MTQNASHETDYLAATSFVDSNHDRIIAIASDLTKPDEPEIQRAVSLFYFVRDQIRYNPFSPMFTPEDYKASTVIKRGYGFCVQKAVALAALCRAARIPCRLCFADIKSHIIPGDLAKLMGTNLFTYHGYCSLYLNGRWIKATPAFDGPMCEKNGYRKVEFDGTVDGVLHGTDIHGNKHIEYIVDHGCFGDVPYQDIVDAFYKTYAKSDPELMKSYIALMKK